MWTEGRSCKAQPGLHMLDSDSAGLISHYWRESKALLAQAEEEEMFNGQ